MKNRIEEIITESINLKKQLLNDITIDKINKSAEVCITAIKDGSSIYFCGNGGSAADAQHLAAELSGRFYYDRDPLPAEALHVNTSYLTAVANDFGYEQVYSRMIRGIGKTGDILFGISTSGNSLNVFNAIVEANNMNIFTIGLAGINENSSLNNSCKITINVPSADTPRIQESHVLIGHIICELIEAYCRPNEKNPNCTNSS